MSMPASRATPQGKGKVERHVRDLRETVDPRREVFDSLEQLQAVTDARLAEALLLFSGLTAIAGINRDRKTLGGLHGTVQLHQAPPTRKSRRRREARDLDTPGATCRRPRCSTPTRSLSARCARSTRG